MVILDPLPGRVVIVNQLCADARNFVRADGGADAAAADCHATFPAATNCASGVTKSGQSSAGLRQIGPNINYFVPCFAKMRNQTFLQLKTTVIRGDSYTHFMPPSSDRLGTRISIGCGSSPAIVQATCKTSSRSGVC